MESEQTKKESNFEKEERGKKEQSFDFEFAQGETESWCKTLRLASLWLWLIK